MDCGMGEAAGYGEFKKGWPVVLSAMLGIGLGLSPLPFYTIGILAKPLAKAFGWGFGQIFFGVSISSIVVPLVSPIIGLLAERFGVRRVALTSLVLFGLSFMAFAASTGSLILFYLNWALVAHCGAGTLPITFTRAVNNRFETRKGLALGLSLLGTGLFGYFGVWYTAFVIAHFGWRAAYVAVGALPLLIAFPVAVLGFRDVGPARQTGAERRAEASARRAATPGMTAREAFADWRFWLIGCAFIPIAFAVGATIPNLANILKQNGFSPETAVGLASLIGLSVIVGRAAGGWLVDRFWAPGVAVVLIGIPAAACWVLAHGALSYGVTAAAVVLVGFAAGAEYDLMAFLTARYFGMKSYGVVYGALYGFFAVGSGFGPPVFGAAFDKSHSYVMPLSVAALAMFMGALALLGLGRYRTFSQPAGASILAEAEATADTRSV
jgi:predicted MFS family arabinose efflux permease